MELFIAKTRNVITELNDNNQFCGIQRDNLRDAHAAGAELTEAWLERKQAYQRLRNENLISAESALEVQTNADDSLLNLRRLELQIQQLDLAAVELQEAFVLASNQMSMKESLLADLQLQLGELDKVEANIEKLRREAAFRDRTEVNDLQRQLDAANRKLAEDLFVRADQGGRVLELTVAEGRRFAGSESSATRHSRR